MIDFQKRIRYQGSLKKLLLQICEFYDIGNYSSHKVLNVGYEDFNVILETSSGKYFVKIFASYRSQTEILRYVNIMLEVVDFHIEHPKLYKGQKGYHFSEEVDGVQVDLVVMEFIPALNLYETQEKLSRKDVVYLSRQAARINNLDIDAIKIYDQWSITNIVNEYEIVSKELTSKQRSLTEPVYKEVKDKLSFSSLPNCFVHGDMTRSNLIKNGDKIHIIDFSVSNVYPRIQELTVLYYNTIFDLDRPDFSYDMYEVMLDEYQKINELNDEEIRLLPLYIEAGFLTNIIGTIKCLGEVDEAENNYWMELGFEGLKSPVLHRIKKQVQ
jgi:Ser/Thr protein kinase RdoA (MazF antagonist)